jgi:hypothetical protein
MSTYTTKELVHHAQLVWQMAGEESQRDGRVSDRTAAKRAVLQAQLAERVTPRTMERLAVELDEHWAYGANLVRIAQQVSDDEDVFEAAYEASCALITSPPRRAD